jgi:hypothetical protein
VQDRAAERRKRMTVRKFTSHAEADADDRTFWLEMPPAERVLLAWILSRQQWALSGKQTDESGLCRSVASVRRG